MWIIIFALEGSAGRGSSTKEMADSELESEEVEELEGVREWEGRFRVDWMVGRREEIRVPVA